jgi:ureidoacrylate peracid hydrolase
MRQLAARPEPIAFDPQRSALVVVDMQNAFLSRGGLFDLAGFDLSAAQACIEVNARLLPECRRAGVKIVYLQMSYRPDLSDGGDASSPNFHKELALVLMRQRPELAGKLLVEGTWDWKIVDPLTPEPGDVVVRKSRYSGFCGTDLHARLDALNVRHLFFTGVATNVCVESTARDAFFAEFFPILVQDAMNHSGPEFTRLATLWNFENVFGWVTDSAQLIETLPASR